MSYVKDKTKNEILEDLRGTAQPASVVHEQQKMGIIVRCTEDLEKGLASLEISMNKNAESSDNLAKKVFYLDVILTVATVAGIILTVSGKF